MNYIPQIAKMLGVEIGEEFQIKGLDFTYFFSETDLMAKAQYGIYGEASLSTFIMLCQGNCEIVKKPWKPDLKDDYFYIGKSNEFALSVMNDFYMARDEDITRYRLGNCYPTKEAAEADREKWERFYADDSPIDWEGKK